jgi:hypothetical protein
MAAKHTLTVASDVAEVLRRSTITDDRVILPPEQLDRKLYTAVSKVLTEFGGKWSKKEGAVLIKDGTKDKLLAALDSGEVKREKVILQAFYTPNDVARNLVAWAASFFDVDDEIQVLEPSAGGGALIRAIQEVLPQAEITAIEINEDAVKELKKDDTLEVLHADFLSLPAASEEFDLIVMNPPYQKGQALKHIQHALTMLGEDGHLFAILPKNFSLDFDSYDVESQDIAAGAFKESGTSIATKMVRFSRG